MREVENPRERRESEGGWDAGGGHEQASSQSKESGTFCERGANFFVCYRTGGGACEGPKLASFPFMRLELVVVAE